MLHFQKYGTFWMNIRCFRRMVIVRKLSLNLKAYMVLEYPVARLVLQTGVFNNETG